MEKKITLPENWDLNDPYYSAIEGLRNSDVETLMNRIITDHYPIEGEKERKDTLIFSLDLYFYGHEWTAKVHNIYSASLIEEWHFTDKSINNALIRAWYFLDGLKRGRVNQVKLAAKQSADREWEDIQKELAEQVAKGEI